MTTAERLPILTYHSVGIDRATPHPELRVAPERFALQVRWLADHGFVGISPTQCADWLLRDGSLPARAVLLTFDDGYANLTEHALPLLESLGFSAGVYVCTRLLGTVTPWDGDRTMTAADVAEWSARGIEFGAHSRSHPHLTSLSREQLVEEVSGSARDLAAITGRTALSFTYPYGEHDDHVVSETSRIAEIAFTVNEGRASRDSNPLRLPRSMVQPDDGPLDMQMHTMLGRNVISKARWRVRRALGMRRP